ncbi:FitA-like ribbon-helix-helix domain-containing protein [Prosthecomicrobium hirschii]|uniref:FitA-like ribbon-helix-helix domain-containing protein n=1 Tax=Prosthecodimorpha hirschii TaxID=665126 RepID=UPI00221E3A3E|nr:TraY domain-containing protein [Prosthecomicrobium hirschii]MCW1841097.1 TraY domain-containing protein [Prosthecomicrobium hirschii]
MGDLLIRGLDPETIGLLAERAEANGRSLSGEAHAILKAALSEPAPDRSAADAFRELREKYGPVEFELPARTVEAPRVDFE